jgi:hypothetical protein
MAYAKLLEKLLQNFFLTMGRAPISAKEWSKLRRQAMELARKEGGDPITGTPFPGWNPKVIEGGKSKKGIEGLMKSGDLTRGTAPKTLPETLQRKKAGLEGQINKEKWIARKKQENKDAIRRFKEKNPRTVEDFRDKGDWDPSGMAQGGIAPLVGEPSYAANFYDDRIPMAGGGALWKFIQGLFIKASNDIRQGKGKWKGLDQKQRIVQHDNLTKKVTEFQETGKLPEGTEQYFDVNPNEAFAKAQTKVAQGGVHRLDERTMLKQKYPGLTDDLLEKILIDDDPQRKAEVLATMDEFLKLKEIGKGEEEAFKIVVDSFQKPTKHAEGGRISNQSGGPLNQEALIQMYLEEGLSYDEAVAAAQATSGLDMDISKKAEGGIMREGLIFGGSAGLKGMWKSIMKSVSKGRDKPVTKLFPKLSARDREMEKVVMGMPEQKAFRAREKDLKIEGIDLLINRLKNDKKILEQQAKNKKMGDPGLDFIMKKLEENMSEAYGPHLKKYTDIDKDILQMETIKKNMIMKDRKLNAEGGRVSYSGGGRTGLPAITYGMPQMNMQGPQMPVGPQPTGIPGGTIVAQNQMQQAPWMGPQMQQGIGGMPRPMAADGGRIGFGLGGFNKARRAFLKMMAGVTAGGVAGASGLLKFGKAAKVAKVAPKVAETIVESNAAGMPAWFPSLVKRVLKEGEDITGKAGSEAMERQTVHTIKLPDSGTPIEVTRDLVTDDIIVDIGLSKHGFASGKFGQPVRLELKKGEWIEPSTEGGGFMTKGGDNVYPGMSKGAMETGETSGKSMKTKDEFWVEEAEFSGGSPENVKFEDSSVNQFGKHESDFSEVEAFATGKTKKGSRKVSESFDKQNEDLADHFSNYPEPDDFAKGGLAYALGE